jgi:hypothetical protein
MGVVTLTVVQNEPEADVVVGLLRASGIKSFHRTTNFPASAYGSMSPVEVVVDESDLARAQKLLEER